ncbi:hypothetical protein D9M68_666910 [compost metagenome]
MAPGIRVGAGHARDRSRPGALLQKCGVNLSETVILTGIIVLRLEAATIVLI